MDENTKVILLSQGEFAIVDAADYEWLSQWKWSLETNHSGNKYAMRMEGKRGNQKHVSMHRVIMGAHPGEEIDHIDGDGLNNRRGNLRKCTHTQNQYNQRKTRGLSKYKGVTFNKGKGRWMAQIRIGVKFKFLGYWNSEKDAAAAYDDAAKFLHGEFAALNFTE